MLLQMVPVLGSLSLSGLELETNVHTNCKGLQSQRHLLKGWAALRHYGIQPNAVVAAFNQEKALVGAFSVKPNLRMDLRLQL